MSIGAVKRIRADSAAGGLRRNQQCVNRVEHRFKLTGEASSAKQDSLIVSGADSVRQIQKFAQGWPILCAARGKRLAMRVRSFDRAQWAPVIDRRLVIGKRHGNDSSPQTGQRIAHCPHTIAGYRIDVDLIKTLVNT